MKFTKVCTHSLYRANTPVGVALDWAWPCGDRLADTPLHDSSRWQPIDSRGVRGRAALQTRTFSPEDHKRSLVNNITVFHALLYLHS